MNNESNSALQLNPIVEQYQRQVHLDFHTSPHIPDVGSEFDATEFARTLKRAHVNSVTIFAKCHHGMCYYPTKTGTQHPALKGRDLMGEQMEALRREGIRCPLYTTVVWEEDAAQKHPEWRQLRRDGLFAGRAVATDNKTAHPGPWKFLNFLNPDYQDYIEAHVRELLDNYEVDGFFFDILFFHEKACWSDESMRFRREHGFLHDDRETQVRFESAAQAGFAEKFSRIVNGRQPEATIFYNSTTHSSVNSQVGLRTRTAFQSHFEIESLPSGFWGYQHFPRMARQIGRWDKPWFGMTGRFQKQWGDFGGIKPQPALEYECFRSQALGGGNSVGDQLPPRGVLDQAAYDLIGAVYAQCEAAEPFYAASQALPQVGVFSPSYPGFGGEADKSEEGVVQMCEEAHYECSILDDSQPLDEYELLILPDSTVITDALRLKLRNYYENGGKLLISHKAGRDAQGNWTLDFLPLSFEGEVEKYPTYWRAHEEFWPEFSKSDRVFYEQGLNVKGGDGTRVLVERVLPYFKRTDVKFSSHFQTPPNKETDQFPAVVAGERFVYFSDPIFREYRQAGNIAARDVWKRTMESLVGEAPFGSGLPTTVLSVPRRRGNDLILTLLHYVPLRKALDIDVIEERMSFAGETLRLPQSALTARLFHGAELPRNTDGSFDLPVAKGRLLIEVPGYFANQE
jgi:hypothetical protein